MSNNVITVEKQYSVSRYMLDSVITVPVRSVYVTHRQIDAWKYYIPHDTFNQTVDVYVCNMIN